MKVHPLPVVVAGSRFGQFYAAASRRPAYRVAGIRARQRRTAALGARVGTRVRCA